MSNIRPYQIHIIAKYIKLRLIGPNPNLQKLLCFYISGNRYIFCECHFTQFNLGKNYTQLIMLDCPLKNLPPKTSVYLNIKITLKFSKNQLKIAKIVKIHLLSIYLSIRIHNLINLPSISLRFFSSLG